MLIHKNLQKMQKNAKKHLTNEKFYDIILKKTYFLPLPSTIVQYIRRQYLDIWNLDRGRRINQIYKYPEQNLLRKF